MQGIFKRSASKGHAQVSHKCTITGRGIGWTAAQDGRLHTVPGMGTSWLWRGCCMHYFCVIITIIPSFLNGLGPDAIQTALRLQMKKTERERERETICLC